MTTPTPPPISSPPRQRDRHVNRPASLCSQLATSFNNDELSDVKLIVGSRVFHAHRMVLASQSEMFRIMFIGPQWVESNQKEITLKEPDECQALFHLFLQFFYSARIHLTEENIVTVRKLADKYQHVHLVKECDHFITEIISQNDVDTVVNWLVTIENVGEKLEHRCLEKLRQEFVRMMTSEATRARLTLDLLLKVIASSRVVVRNELMLFNLAAAWAMEQRHSTRQKSAVAKMLPLIHFQRMTVHELKLVESSALATKYTELLIPYMYKSYKRLAMDEEMDASDEDVPHLPPRFYMDAPWSGGFTKPSNIFLSSAFGGCCFNCSVIDRALHQSLTPKTTDTWRVLYKREYKKYDETEEQLVIKRMVVTHEFALRFEIGEKVRNYEITFMTGFAPTDETTDSTAFTVLTTKKHHGSLRPLGMKRFSRRKIKLHEVIKPVLLAGCDYVVAVSVHFKE